MDLTVIVPTHNRAALLDKTLASLAVQTQPDFQTLVVDHGSTEDIRAVCAQYEDRLHAQYHWLEKTINSPGLSRHFAMLQVITPLAAFLDCGIVVPTFYAAAHRTFHQTHPRHVGLGHYHGYRPEHPRDDLWPPILERIPLDEAANLLSARPELADYRWGIPLDHRRFAWVFGWTGNYSIETEDYWSVGGFNREIEYLFEDVDLSYRLSRKGVNFAIVPDGWGIHLPHPRPPERVRRKIHYMGREHCYRQLRSLGMEIIYYAGLGLDAADATFDYLSEIGQDLAKLPSASQPAVLDQVSRPALLIGGTTEDAAHYEYVALCDEQWSSTEQLWSCSGLRIPLEDQTLACVVVSDMWKWLNRGFTMREVTLLECLIADIKRATARAIFLNSAVPLPAQREQCSIEQLTRLCQFYGLEFQLLSLEQ